MSIFANVTAIVCSCVKVFKGRFQNCVMYSRSQCPTTSTSGVRGLVNASRDDPSVIRGACQGSYYDDDSEDAE